METPDTCRLSNIMAYYITQGNSKKKKNVFKNIKVLQFIGNLLGRKYQCFREILFKKKKRSIN